MSVAPGSGGDSVEWGQSQGVTHHMRLHSTPLTGGWKWDMTKYLWIIVCYGEGTFYSKKDLHWIQTRLCRLAPGRSWKPPETETAQPVPCSNALQFSWGSIFFLIWSKTSLLKFMMIIFCSPDMHLHKEPGSHLLGNILAGTGQVPEAFFSPSWTGPVTPPLFISYGIKPLDHLEASTAFALVHQSLGGPKLGTIF